MSPRSGHRIPTLQRYYMVAIFTLTASLLYADQNLMAPNLSLIAEEFGFNEEEKTKCARFQELLREHHTVESVSVPFTSC